MSGLFLHIAPSVVGWVGWHAYIVQSNTVTPKYGVYIKTVVRFRQQKNPGKGYKKIFSVWESITNFNLGFTLVEVRERS